MARKPTKTHRDNSTFLSKWGIAAHDLADVENTTTTAIHMRVMRFGTPFQRRAKISPWEKKYGKTLGEIALELDLHPVTVDMRERVYGTAYCDHMMSDQGGWNKGRKRIEENWWEMPRYARCQQRTFFTLEDALKRLKKLKR